ncbi:MAG TPA: hypothetical protein VIH61_10295 [Waddliaceae bacterium]
MNLIELIGFIISMVALFLLMFKQAKEAKRRKEHPEEDTEELQEEEAVLQELLHSLNIQNPNGRSPAMNPRIKMSLPQKSDLPKEPEGPLRHPVKMARLQQKKFIDPHQKAYSTESKLHTKKDLLKRVSLKEVVVLSTLLGPPKGQ